MIAWDADFVVRLDQRNAAIVKNRVNHVNVLKPTFWERIGSDDDLLVNS
jgi:hypothetical protein